MRSLSTAHVLTGIAVYAVLGLSSFLFYYGVVRNYTLTDTLCSLVLGWATDTRWADGFSEKNFSRIRIGMMQQEVRSIVGEPIRTPSEQYWDYTISPGSTHYHLRAIAFSSSGQVTNILKGFHFD